METNDDDLCRMCMHIDADADAEFKDSEIFTMAITDADKSWRITKK